MKPETASSTRSTLHLSRLNIFNFSALKSCFNILSSDVMSKVSKGAKIRNRYNQVPHPTQDTNGKVTNSQLDTTNESQEVSPFPAGDHKAQINRRAQRHSKHKTEQKHKRFIGIMEGDCTHNPEDWKNKSIK